jgi:hypothetical protein
LKEVGFRERAKTIRTCTGRFVVRFVGCLMLIKYEQALMIQGSFKELLLSLPSEQQSVYKNAMRAVKAAKRSGVLSKKNR